MPRDERGLPAHLSATDAAAIIVSNVIGSGIFFTPVLIAQLVPNPTAMLAAWLTGGVLAFLGAAAYAELAALHPRAGGEYVYLREAFGPLAGFLTGWTSFVAGFSGAIAAGAVALARYLGRFVPAAANTDPLLTVPLPLVPLTLSSQSLFALGVIAGLSFVHYRGLGIGRVVQNGLTAVKFGALLAFVLVGFTFGKGSSAHFAGAETVSGGGWLLALIPVMFSYSGWNAAAYVAEEIRDPARNVPRALAFGTGAVVIIYMALNLLYVYAMPLTDLAQLQGGLLDVTGERLFTVALGDVFAAFTVVSIAASVSAMILTGPRVYYAMARDGLFLDVVKRVHPRWRTPGPAIWIQALWSSLLVSCGSLGELVNYTGFAVMLFAGMAVLALFVLRVRQPRAARPFRAWGYPAAPALFVVVTVLVVFNDLWSRPGPALAGLLVIGAGVPLYWFLRRGSV